MKVKRVVAIDPGGALSSNPTTHPGTGIAFRNEDSDRWTTEAYDPDAVLMVVAEFGPDVVVVERFATAGFISKFGLQVVELVGMLREYAREREVEFIKHQPQARRSFMSIAASSVYPGAQKGKKRSRHENDALAHLLLYEYQHKEDSTTGEAWKTTIR